MGRDEHYYYIQAMPMCNLMNVKHLNKDGCHITEWRNEKGGMVVDIYNTIYPRQRKRDDLWDTLQTLFVCPFCGYTWEPRNVDALACTVCKRYFHKNREPRPEGIEKISNLSWERDSLLKTPPSEDGEWSTEAEDMEYEYELFYQWFLKTMGYPLSDRTEPYVEPEPEPAPKPEIVYERPIRIVQLN